MHRAFIGRLVGTGLYDELTAEAYAVIDGVDGRAHHVRFRGIEAFAHAPPPAAYPGARQPLGHRPRPAGDGAGARPGSTTAWSNVSECPLAMGGFGQEVREALAARSEHLATEGHAPRKGPRTVPQRDLLATLRRREVDAAGARLSAETGLPYMPAASTRGVPLN
jgi:hypothetical protein